MKIMRDDKADLIVGANGVLLLGYGWVLGYGLTILTTLMTATNDVLFFGGVCLGLLWTLGAFDWVRRAVRWGDSVLKLIRKEKDD
jgi:hypothetical protein